MCLGLRVGQRQIEIEIYIYGWNDIVREIEIERVRDSIESFWVLIGYSFLLGLQLCFTWDSGIGH